VCPRWLRACLGVLVELSAPPTDSASAPRGSKMRGGDQRWCAGGNRCRHPSNGAGRIAAGRDGGSGGGRSSLGSTGRSQRCRRSVRGSGPTGARRAGGGGVAGPALAPLGPSRGCRQRRDRPDWHRVCDRFLPPFSSSRVPFGVRPAPAEDAFSARAPSAWLAALTEWRSVVSRWCCRAVRRTGRCLTRPSRSPSCSMGSCGGCAW
jgi:hypothetical protein